MLVSIQYSWVFSEQSNRINSSIMSGLKDFNAIQSRGHTVRIDCAKPNGQVSVLTEITKRQYLSLASRIVIVDIFIIGASHS